MKKKFIHDVSTNQKNDVSGRSFEEYLADATASVATRFCEVMRDAGMQGLDVSLLGTDPRMPPVLISRGLLPVQAWSRLVMRVSSREGRQECRKEGRVFVRGTQVFSLGEMREWKDFMKENGNE